jgi:hypothetical protein
MARLISRNSVNFNHTEAVGAALQGRDVDAVVSGGVSSEITRTATITDIMAKPVIGYTSTANTLSNEQLFPTYARVVPPDKFQAIALAQMVSALGWTRVGVLHAKEVYGEGLAAEFTQECLNRNITVVSWSFVQNCFALRIDCTGHSLQALLSHPLYQHALSAVLKLCCLLVAPSRFMSSSLSGSKLPSQRQLCAPQFGRL